MPEHRPVVRKAVEESFALLKNDSVFALFCRGEEDCADRASWG